MSFKRKKRQQLKAANKQAINSQLHEEESERMERAATATELKMLDQELDRVEERRQMVIGGWDPELKAPYTDLQDYQKVVGSLRYISTEEQAKISGVIHRLRSEEQLSHEAEAWNEHWQMIWDLPVHQHN